MMRAAADANGNNQSVASSLLKRAVEVRPDELLHLVIDALERRP
jgi:hypothetical protein